MRCHICDSSLSAPQYNRDHSEWDPCVTCLNAISDLLNEDKDNVVWYDEDPLPDAPTSNFEDMFMTEQQWGG